MRSSFFECSSFWRIAIATCCFACSSSAKAAFAFSSRALAAASAARLSCSASNSALAAASFLPDTNLFADRILQHDCSLVAFACSTPAATLSSITAIRRTYLARSRPFLPRHALCIAVADVSLKALAAMASPMTWAARMRPFLPSHTLCSSRIATSSLRHWSSRVCLRIRLSLAFSLASDRPHFARMPLCSLTAAASWSASSFAASKRRCLSRLLLDTSTLDFRTRALL
mmetsp:Transcript_55562/g.75869  ORF Transcript_55562/g.75869 Transcript_55562/m.75869 type:complete len:229 (+) Transcript_55562:1322-2008(+)